MEYFCLIMSETYIKNHFSDIKSYADVIEKRLDDKDCTMERTLADNARFLALSKEHHVNYVLINRSYDIDLAKIELRLSEDCL